jgi:cytochrome c biogenesis factor
MAVGYPLLLLVMALPFVALLNWRGDVRGGDLLWAYVILLVTAVLLAVVSLAISAWSRQSATALVIAYAVVLVLCAGVPLRLKSKHRAPSGMKSLSPSLKPPPKVNGIYG